MSLVNDIKTIQRAVGAEPFDGVVGPVTVRRLLEHFRRTGLLEPVAEVTEDDALDERTLEHVASLDPKARERFVQFIKLAKATAATFGCDYIGIEGHRTWEEQDALKAKRPVVTRAAGGYSNHNFGIAMDFGVFRGKSYLDDTNPALSRQVHAACAVHAGKLGIDWGGDWKTLKDGPHYEISTGLTMAQKRELYRKKGSVLS